MKPAPSHLIGDLADEHQALDTMVSALDPAAWRTPTPAQGWDIADTISHLYFYDETARLAAADPEPFRRHATELVAGRLGPDHDVRAGRSLEPAELLERWRQARAGLLSALAETAPSGRIPWYGPDMSPASFTTARLMETWAHGLDVADALGLPPVVSHRLRHVCHIGVGARRYSFFVHGIDDPGDPIRIEVEAPDGSLWTWGEPDAADRVGGLALDLALVVTHRRHIGDTGLRIEGPVARRWLSIAQSFAGPPGSGRSPGLRPLSQTVS
ncbi:TIGR03084 family metal-binding protein [Streptosporangium sp. NPDC002607]